MCFSLRCVFSRIQLTKKKKNHWSQKHWCLECNYLSVQPQLHSQTLNVTLHPIENETCLSTQITTQVLSGFVSSLSTALGKWIDPFNKQQQHVKIPRRLKAGWSFSVHSWSDCCFFATNQPINHSSFSLRSSSPRADWLFISSPMPLRSTRPFVFSCKMCFSCIMAFVFFLSVSHCLLSALLSGGAKSW